MIENLKIAFKKMVSNPTDENFDVSTTKNKPSALDGSIRDAITVLQYFKLLDCKIAD